MDTAELYRKAIRDLIRYFAQLKPSHGDIETEVVMDEANGHYELIHVGWSDTHRIHGSVIHIDIRGDKVYIQHNGTEDFIASELVKAGIPADHIVLAFMHPRIRPHTGYAVA